MPTPKQHPEGSATQLRLLVPTLVRMVRSKHWWFGQEKIEDAVMAAIEHRMEQDKDFLKKADKEIEEADLRSLAISAYRIASNGVRAERRRVQRECEYARQKKICIGEKFFVPNELSAEDIYIEVQRDELERLLEGFRSWEREFVWLRAQGSRDLMAYASLLGMEASPIEEQQQTVKRTWNRLRKRMQRWTQELKQGSI